MKRAIKLAILAPLALFAMLGMTGCYDKPASGEMGVVRNGGPFDNHKIRQIIPNGAGNTWTGWGSETHFYPVDTQQRFFKLNTCYDGDNSPVACNGSDAAAIEVPTADGVQVGIEGIFYLNTTFNNTAQGEEALKSFDTQFGTRTFEGEHPWDGPSGWRKYLAAVVEPVIGNNMREVIANVECRQLVSSCALVQNGSNVNNVSQQSTTEVKNNVSQVQQAIQEGLQRDLNDTLCPPKDKGKVTCQYFGQIRFNLTHVDLPPKVKGAIEDAQSSFARVSQAQAKVKAARLEAQANEERQHGYAKCPTCALIDQTRAIPTNIQVWAPGARYSVTGK